jgi:hypothetical protein
MRDFPKILEKSFLGGHGRHDLDGIRLEQIRKLHSALRFRAHAGHLLDVARVDPAYIAIITAMHDVHAPMFLVAEYQHWHP